MPKNYWDYDRDTLVTSAELYKHYGEMIVKGEINPEDVSFSDYMTDCMSKNGTLISVRGAINEKAINDASEVIDFGIDKLAERYGLKIDINDYPEINMDQIVEGVANFIKSTLLSALAREEC